MTQGKRLERRAREGGFTLMELLVVLAILGLLIGLVAPNVMNALSGAQTDTARTQIANLEQALEMYRIDVGRYPANNEGLKALVEKPADAAGWNGPYLKKGKLPQDPWNKDFQYRNPGEHGDIDIFTYGSNGALGGEGDAADVGNWQ